MKLALNEAIISAEDLRSVINELKDYTDYLRHAQIKQHVVKRSAGIPAPELSLAASQLLSEVLENRPLNIGEVETLIGELQKVYDDSPKLKIILAALPPAAVKKKLTAWIRINIAPLALVEYSYNQSILGGMVLNAGSHIFDWSLRQQLIDARPKLNEMIASHV